MNTFGQRLKALRREKSCSQAYLAEQIGVSVQSVSNWECDNTMPDITQIVPLAAVLEVTTDCLLGVGKDARRDKEDLEREIDRIWAEYSVNTPENNADLLAYDAYQRYLVRYPLDYEVRYRCALAVNDYLTVTTERKKFDISAETRECLSAESARLLHTVVDNSPDMQLRLDAQKALIALLLLKGRYADAETEARCLPAQYGIRAETLSRIARSKSAFSDAYRYAHEACREKLTDYTNALFYRAEALSGQPDADQETVLSAWRIMQTAAETLTVHFADPAVLAVNAYERNPFCYRITAYTACSNFLLDRGDLPGALSCAAHAADAAVEMVDWARAVCHDPLILSDIRFFAEHTPGWCLKWASPAAADTMRQSDGFRMLTERVDACVRNAAD